MKAMILLFLLGLSLPAKDVTSAWFVDGKFTEESDCQKMTNGFGGRLDFTDDPNFLNDWRKSWNSISAIKHGGGLYAVLFVVDDTEAETNLVYDLTIMKPDNSPYISFTNLPALKSPINLGHASRPVPAPSILKLSPRFTIIQIDPQDPAGVYTVEAVLKSKAKQIQIKLKKQFTVYK